MDVLDYFIFLSVHSFSPYFCGDSGDSLGVRVVLFCERGIFFLCTVIFSFNVMFCIEIYVSATYKAAVIIVLQLKV